jgi:uncharacterized membrane protein YdbT with pleckstrin-like domain
MRTRLGREEKVILTLRKHFLVLAKPFLLVIATLIINYYLYKYVGQESKIRDMGPYLIIFSLVFFLYKYYYEMRNNIWIVTNYRIINETGFLSVNSKESPLGKINNVSYHQSLPGRILNYGDISIQTAAEAGETKFTFAAYPREFVARISEFQESKQDNKNIKI